MLFFSNFIILIDLLCLLKIKNEVKSSRISLFFLYIWVITYIEFCKHMNKGYVYLFNSYGQHYKKENKKTTIVGLK